MRIAGKPLQKRVAVESHPRRICSTVQEATASEGGEEREKAPEPNRGCVCIPGEKFSGSEGGGRRPQREFLHVSWHRRCGWIFLPGIKRHTRGIDACLEPVVPPCGGLSSVSPDIRRGSASGLTRTGCGTLFFPVFNGHDHFASLAAIERPDDAVFGHPVDHAGSATIADPHRPL